MLRSYLQVAVRGLVNNRVSSLINLFGLACGLAACVTILLFVRYELSYDHWIPGADRVYQLQTKYVMGPAREELLSQTSPYAVGAALKSDFPQIETLVHAQRSWPRIVHAGAARNAKGLLLTDGPFFDVLALPFIQGDPRTALAEPGSVVLTESEAASYFGRKPALGATLTFESGGASDDYRVTGVIRDLPKNTHLDFTMLARFDPLSPPNYASAAINDWSGSTGYTYLKLAKNAEPHAIIAALPGWIKRTAPSPDPRFPKDWRLVKLTDIHLGKANGPRPNAEMGFITSFAVVAVLIAGMACINFTNLATAQASRRAREVALRKLLGATRTQLATQFLLEALLFAVIAMLLALALLELALPHLSRFLDVDLVLADGDVTGLALPIVGLTLVVGLVSGAYPAFYLSRFRPGQILRANAGVPEAPGAGRLRTMLVILQFAVSISLVICTTVIYRQTVFARTVELGYDPSALLQISNAGELGPAIDAFEQEVRRLPGVRSASRTAVGPGRPAMMIIDLTTPGMSAPLEVGGGYVGPGFFATAGAWMVAGREFDERRLADEFTADGSANVVINEAAVKSFGFRSPDSALGQTINIAMRAPTSTIIGVVQDARFDSVREPVLPQVYAYDRSELPLLLVRYDAEPLAVRQRVDEVWRRFAPPVAIEAEFSQDLIDRLYEADETRGKIFAAFALVAVLIAVLGLFGLAVFTAEHRRKEVAIRRVFGARSRDIVRLLAWRFARPVLLANLIAWPAAWWLMRDWLNQFDARIALTPMPFVAAGLLALAVAVGTIAGHTLRIVRASPVLALRYE